MFTYYIWLQSRHSSKFMNKSDGPVQHGIFLPEGPRVNFQHRLFYGVHSAPMCNRSTTVCALKILDTGHMKILHKLVGMGSTALASAVLYPGKVTKISHKGQRSTKTKQNKNNNKTVGFQLTDHRSTHGRQGQSSRTADPWWWPWDWWCGTQCGTRQRSQLSEDRPGHQPTPGSSSSCHPAVPPRSSDRDAPRSSHTPEHKHYCSCHDCY